MRMKNGQEVTFRPLTGIERLALLRAYQEYSDRPAAMVRLETAALGLGWLLPAPSWRSLKEHDYDLIAYGEEVAACLADQDPILLAGEADQILAAAFRVLGGDRRARDEARGFSGETAGQASAGSSGSGSPATATPSP